MARNYLCYAFIDGYYLHFVDIVDMHFVICLNYCDMKGTIYAIVDMNFVICKKLSMLLSICILLYV
jgi:hypothetical protein